jgi:hypothetical protein
VTLMPSERHLINIRSRGVRDFERRFRLVKPSGMPLGSASSAVVIDTLVCIRQWQVIRASETCGRFLNFRVKAVTVLGLIYFEWPFQEPAPSGLFVAVVMIAALLSLL